MNALIACFIYIGSAMPLKITACRLDCYGIIVSYSCRQMNKLY